MDLGLEGSVSLADGRQMFVDLLRAEDSKHRVFLPDDSHLRHFSGVHPR